MDLFRSLLRGLKAFRIEKIAKNFALLDRLQNFAEFSHSLRPFATFAHEALELGARIGAT